MSGPVDLLHMDTKRYARFSQPGHAKTGDRRAYSLGAGHEYVHSVIDDHSRLADSELHQTSKPPPSPRLPNVRWPGMPAAASPPND